MSQKLIRTEAEWRGQLSEEQYWVTREKGTERPFTGEFHDCKTPGDYVCVCCGSQLFDSETKFDSGTGWPSFWQPASAEASAWSEKRWFAHAATLTSAIGSPTVRRQRTTATASTRRR